METASFAMFIKEMPRFGLGKKEVHGAVTRYFGGNSFVIHIVGDNASADEAMFGYYDPKKSTWWANNCGMIDGEPKIPYFKDKSQLLVKWSY